MVRGIFAEYKKELDEAQMKALLAKKDSDNPLWLAVACEELRVYGQFKHLTDKIEILPGTTQE